MSEWQDIETAPRDGTVVLLWAEDAAGPVEMAWDPEGFNPLASLRKGIWVGYGGQLTWSEDRGAGPTHWMPLPEPPK